MKNKKGALLDKEVIEIILAAAGVFVLFFIFFNLITSSFDKKEEVSKAIFEDFLKSLEKVKKEGFSEFYIWQKQEKKEEYFIVYFGKVIRVDYNEKSFFSIGKNQNRVCSCYLDKKDKYLCNPCKDLDLPLKVSEEAQDLPFVLLEGYVLNISKGESCYLYEIKKK